MFIFNSLLLGYVIYTGLSIFELDSFEENFITANNCEC